MKFKNPNRHYRCNERIGNTIPSGLILKKADEETLRDISVYDVIAWHAGLTCLRDDIYVSESGEEFIRTRFGFQPADQYNHNVLQAESDEWIKELERKLKVANKRIEEQQNRIKRLEERDKEWKEREDDRIKLHAAEVDRMRDTIDLLRLQLYGSKKIAESIKIKPVTKRTEDKTEWKVSGISDLDWSAYNDIVSDSERRIAS
jgi:hypothetical protein